MSQKPIYFVTYKRSDGVLNVDSVIYRNAVEKKFTPKYIKGYSLKENPDIKPNKVMFLNIRDKVLPKLMNMKAKGYLIAEDDAIINANASELNTIIKKNGGDKNILWIGYQKIYRRKGEIDYVVGAQMIYVPRNRLREMKSVMDSARPQLYDRFLLNFRDKIGLKLVPQKLKIKFNPDNLYPEPGKLVDEMTGESVTKGTRKGKDLKPEGNVLLIKRKKRKKQPAT